MNTAEPKSSYKAIDQLISEKLIGIYAEWQQSSAGRIGPKREEIVLARVRAILPWLWMIDVVDGGKDFRFRLAGDRIIQFMGRRYAGSLLSQQTDGPFFERMRQSLSQCVQTKKPLAIGPVPTGYAGKDHLEMEVVILPLSEDGQNVTCLFGAMDTWLIGSKTGR